jgi:hypothetical protein
MYLLMWFPGKQPPIILENVGYDEFCELVCAEESVQVSIDSQK